MESELDVMFRIKWVEDGNEQYGFIIKLPSQISVVLT